MDLGEILGGLLGRKARKRRKPAPEPDRRTGGSGRDPGSPEDVRSLEDMLGVGRDRRAERTPERRAERAEPRRPRFPDTEDLATDAYGRYRRRRGEPFDAPPKSELDDERAALLIRAMVNAAKADGQLDEDERKAIFGELGDVTDEEIDYLNREFHRPLDVKEFAWSVPIGMEEQVYGFSLLAVGVDRQAEVDYLKDLAHGLRLSDDERDRIRRRFDRR